MCGGAFGDKNFFKTNNCISTKDTSTDRVIRIAKKTTLVHTHRRTSKT